MVRAAMSWRALDANIELPGGAWLLFATTLPDTGPSMSPRLVAALLVAAGIIAALTAWAVRRATAPLRLLSDAAERLGRNVQSAPLPVAGTIEMQRASVAFNDMQARLRRLIENRTLMLAAISHDLRTELTLLRLKAEGIESAEDRERLMATIGEMEAMLTATLSFAREEAASEPAKRTDVGALVTSMVDDLADAGRDVTMIDASERIIADVKPIALRRALTNLIENAVKYGARARVSLTTSATGIAICVDDDGPGIPEEDLQRVLQPFFRLDPSRSRDTGGMGLGLAIAASVADAHGGFLRLVNRPERGLRAVLEMPVAAEQPLR
jgi:signal transduction histidine kinase